MRAQTEERCKAALAMVEKGAAQQDALKKHGLSGATFQRYKASLRSTKSAPVLPHGHSKERTTEASNASAMTTNRSHSPSIANNVQIALYEQEISLLRIVNKKLSEIIAEIMN